MIANIIDHFDTTVYSFLAPILAPIFFPNFDPIVQLILAYSLLATSLITRPLGAFIFGIIAKNYGPVMSLFYSLAGIAIATFSIGILPGYDSIGGWSTFLLVLSRFVKGFFSAGESTVSQLYLLENKRHRQSFRASYFFQSSTMISIILASAMSSFILSSKEYYGLWRLCFVFSASIGIIGFWFRRYANTKYSVIIQDTRLKFSQNWPIMIKIALITGFSNMTYYIPFVIMNSIIPLITDIKLDQLMFWNTVLLVLDLILILVLGKRLIKYDFRKILFFPPIMLAISIPFLFYSLNKSNIYFVNLVRVWIVFWGVIFLCPLNLCYRTIVPRNGNQYFLFGMSTALGIAFIGKLLPMFSLWLWSISKTILSLALFISLFSSVIVILLYKEFYKKNRYNINL